MSLPDLLLAGLALWRVSALLSYETGPWGAFMRLRAKFGIVPDEQGEPNEWPHTYMASLLVCPWCLSLVLAIPLAALWVVAPGTARILSLPFALSALAILVEKLNHG